VIDASEQVRCPTVESWGGENEIMKQRKKGAAWRDLGIESGVRHPGRMVTQLGGRIRRYFATEACQFTTTLMEERSA